MTDQDAKRLPPVHIILLAAGAFLGFFSNIWNTPLFDLDEGAFSEATLEMLRSGNYLTTTLNGLPRYAKPILTYWTQAASVTLFGVHDFAFRLPSAISATLWMLAVWFFARRYAGGYRAALVAALAVPLSLMSGIIGHAAIADALLNLFLALTFFDIYRYFDQPRRTVLLRVYLWMGLGLLTKGPVAVVLPLLVSFLFFMWQRRMGDWRRAVINPLGWLVLLATIAPWVVPLYLHDQGAFLDHFIMQQNIGRYTSTMQGHGGEIWYYLIWAPVIVLPFTALLPRILRSGFGRDPSPLDGYLVLWFGVTFVLFSFSETQLPDYLLYGCSGLFVLFGKYHAEAPRRPWTLLPALLLGGIVAALPWILPLIPVPANHPYEQGIIHLAEKNFDRTYDLLAFSNLFILAALVLWGNLPSWRALLVAAFAQGLIVWYGVVPVLAKAQQVPIRDAALLARDMGLPTVTYETYLPSFSVYRGAITPPGIPRPGELVFVNKNHLAGLERALHHSPMVTEYDKGGVELLLRPGS